jgi:carboxypeptidase Q
MRSVWRVGALWGCACAYAVPGFGQVSGMSLTGYQSAADSLINAALHDSTGYHRLGELVDRFGSRLSGSSSLEHAIDWVLEEMRRDGLENVRGEPVMVPHWVRGAESARLVSPRHGTLHMLGIGGSVATPSGGITAPLLVVRSFEDLRAHAAQARGRIVLFDVPWDKTLAPGQAYDALLPYRSRSPAAAARVGAVAVLIRSLTSQSLQTPHTGSTSYDSASQRLPIAALTVEDAAMLHRMQDRGARVVVHLAMAARSLPDVPSRNVVAELVGRERPEEVVVLGGHIDSWDVGQGALDDGGGAVVAWHAVRLMNRLGMRPRRTVRVVLWTNEENGGRGMRAYRDAHRDAIDRHVLAMESDDGVFAPRGFHATGTDSAVDALVGIAHLLDRIGAGTITQGEASGDVEALSQLGVPALGVDVDDSSYYWYHHSSADMFSVIDPDGMAKCVAAMAVMAYVAADMPSAIPRGVPPTR